MIEVKHLRLIAAIERTGTLSLAAKELHLTQSALSHQLRQLEEELGIPLFRRQNNQLHFTAAGKAFREKAEQILGEFNSLETEMETLRIAQQDQYVHGYSAAEAQRLQDQAQSVTDFIHWDSHWPAGERVLEVGCGVGAQTEIIARQNPDTKFVSIDISESSLQMAKERIAAQGLQNVSFAVGDAEQLDYSSASFDHVFVCFVLEHLPKPEVVLQELNRVLKPNGTITVVEGDHGSTFFHPDNDAARAAVQAQVTLQQKGGGDANIGRRLYPLLQQQDFQQIQVSPRQVYVDDAKPKLVDGFIRNTFTAMIQGIAEDAVAEQIVDGTTMKRGIEALLNTAAGGGTFSYTFFKAMAYKE
ncbi:MAG: methyltransferase domain-containing protein [Bacteroidota bacterium]